VIRLGQVKNASSDTATGSKAGRRGAEQANGGEFGSGVHAKRRPAPRTRARVAHSRAVLRERQGR
jgi:hypothetical protein